MSAVEKVMDSMSDFFSGFIDSTSVTEGTDGTAIISTPFLDRHNDIIEVYVSESDEGFVLSDGGYFISDLHMCGCDPTKGKRAHHLSTILTSSGSALENGIITKKVSVSEFGEDLFTFIQALLSVGDLYYTSKSSVASMFHDDVMEWISTNHIVCESDVCLKGRTYSYRVDFILTDGDRKRIIQTMNVPSKDKLASVVMMKQDLDPDCDVIVIINDSNASGRTVSNICDASRSFGIIPLLWSEKDYCSLMS